MKKILLLLVLIYSYSFSSTVSTTYEDFISRKTGLSCTATVNTSTIWSMTSGTSYSYDGGNRLLFSKGTSTRGDANGNNGHFTIINYICHTPKPNEPLCVSNSNANGVLYCKSSTDLDPDFNLNPDPLGGGQCRDLFQKDGVAYTCNPNSNEATPIPNSNGTILDPETGTDKPNCNEGYDFTAVASFPQQGSTAGGYTSWGCAATTGTGDTGNTSGTGGTGSGDTTPTVTTNPDGSKTWNSPDGNTYNLTANGTLTTTYPDGSSSVSQVGSGYQAGSSGGSSGGSGSSGGGTGGTNGNTTNENNTTPTEDNPIDNTPVANSCTDSNLTLQEKMLCELNAGMKKQNSEGNPSNSLNQLLKDLKTSNQTDNTAMNTNLKDIKALNENQLNKQTQANTTLEKINDSANATELYTKVMNEGINKISGTLDGIAEFVTTVSDFVKDPSQIGDLMNNKLGEVSNKYQNKILNDSCGVCPTISIPYHGTNVTLLNQTLLDTYFPIAMMKTIIILTFAFAGFMNFFRSSN